MESVPVTSDHLYLFLASCGIHITYLLFIKKFVPYIGKDRRKLSWVLTAVTALVVSILGPLAAFGNIRTIWSEQVPYELYAISNNHIVSEGHQQYRRFDINFDNSNRLQDQSTYSWNQLEEKNEGAPTNSIESVLDLYKEYDAKYTSPASWKQSLSHTRCFFDLRFTDTDNKASQTTILFFAGYLLIDLIIGSLYYREHITIVAGWIHHSMYLYFCYYAVSHRATVIFVSFMLVEVPTFIVGLGFLHKPLRNDMVFTSSFLLFRIVFDYLLSHEYLMNRPDINNMARLIIICKSAMNLKFFIDLIQQQIKLRRKRRALSMSTVSEKVIHSTEGKIEPISTLHSSVVEPIATTKENKSIITIVHQQYHPRQVRGKLSNNNLFELSETTSAFSTSFIPKSISDLKSRGLRHEAGSVLDDQPALDMITAH